MADEYTVDHKSTYDHFIHILSSGVDRYGSKIDLEHFDSDYLKTIRDLWTEVTSRDAFLVFDPKTRIIDRHADSAWVTISELRRARTWLEYMRSYPSGRVHRKKKRCTTSETLKPWETPMQGALRCLKWEEMRTEWERIEYVPTDSDLVPSLAQPRTDRHWSTVYPTRSNVTIKESYEFYLDFLAPERTLGSKIIVTKDTDGRGDASPQWTKTYIKSFPYQ
jgi:hypothetical protein